VVFTPIAATPSVALARASEHTSAEMLVGSGNQEYWLRCSAESSLHYAFSNTSRGHRPEWEDHKQYCLLCNLRTHHSAADINQLISLRPKIQTSKKAAVKPAEKCCGSNCALARLDCQ
jgi:hypothetical protein